MICAHREEKHFGSLASVDFCGSIIYRRGLGFGCSSGRRVACGIRSSADRRSPGMLAGPRSLASFGGAGRPLVCSRAVVRARRVAACGPGHPKARVAGMQLGQRGCLPGNPISGAFFSMEFGC